MITNRKVLEFIAEMEDEFQSVRVADVQRKFKLSRAAATDHLRRLWKDRLIEAGQFRTRGYKFRPKPGESLGSLKFRMTSRGRDRMNWHEENDGDLDWLLK